MMQWTEGNVLQRLDWTEGLFSLKIQADIKPFMPGQFASLAMDIEDKRVAKPYSFINSSIEQPLEFYISSVPNGILTTHLKQLNENDKIWIKSSANGLFTVEEIPTAKNLWLFSSGTGIGPFLSILNANKVWDKFQHVILIHAVSEASGLNYQDQIHLLQQQYQQLSVVNFVSREQISNTINGRIPTAIEDGRLENSANLELLPSNSHCMLCGNPGMVKDTTTTLINRGFKKHRRRSPGQITTEKYW